MIRNRDFVDRIRFRKTIEDLFLDSNSGLFVEMGATDEGGFVHNNVPQFIVDGIFDLDLLDISFYDKYSERFLNKTSANEYSIGLDGELVNPADLSRLSQQILDYFFKKWDNLYYLYYKIVMGTDYNPIENYSSHEKTTYNSLKDELKKEGTEKSAQESEIQQKPLLRHQRRGNLYSDNTMVNDCLDRRGYVERVLAAITPLSNCHGILPTTQKSHQV